MQGMKLTYVSLVITVGTSSYTALTPILLSVTPPLYTRGTQNQTPPFSESVSLMHMNMITCRRSKTRKDS